MGLRLVRPLAGFRPSPVRFALFLLAFCIPLAAGAGECIARSGPYTSALVELYTSESCSSCAPADRWLSSLGGYASGRAVPVALYVDYGHYIGSKGQRRLTPLQRMALVYMPQVLLQGRDFRGWGTNAFDRALARINAIPARARLQLDIVSLDAAGLRVAAAAQLVQPARHDDAVLFLAASHGNVVLEWQGPFAFAGGKLRMERLLPLLPRAVPTNSGVVGFVQDRRTAEVLQALMRPAC